LLDELFILTKALHEAGRSIEAIRKTNLTVIHKTNHDPLTEADLAANNILQNQLLSHFPHDGWLSEENKDDTKRLHHQRVWIIDPIDGTKEFIQHLPEYVISVALVENHIPVLAAVYHPVHDQLFYAIKGHGTWLRERSADDTSLKEKRVTCDDSSSSTLTILASRTEVRDGKWEAIKKIHHVKEVGSIAYKLALIASGQAQATISFAPKHEWDIAAGVLLVTEAGGTVTDLSGRPFLFNQAELLVNGVIAAGQQNHEKILKTSPLLPRFLWEERVRERRDF